MATASRFNRPYAELKGGTGSLANRPATPSGRGYYDPARILERVARGRPGTTMQQAAAASEAYGMGVVNKLLEQNQQRLDQQKQGAAGMQQDQNQGQGITSYMNGMLNIGGTVPQNAQLQMPKQENRLSRRNQPSWSSDFLFSTAPNTQTFGL